MVATRRPAPEPLVDIFDDLVRQPERRPYMGIPRRRVVPPTNVFTGRVHRKPTKLMPKFYQDRDERHRAKLVKMLEAEITFIGRSYSYKVETTPLGKVGIFSVYGTDVLTINLDSGTISSVYIPLESQVLEGQHKKQLNLVRLLFRRLGIKAVREKAFTVLEINDFIKVLEPGETWELPTQAALIVLPKKVKREWTQLPLIPEELYRKAEKEYNDEKTRKQIEEYQRHRAQQRNTWSTVAPTASINWGTSSTATTSIFSSGTSTTASSPYIVYRTSTFQYEGIPTDGVGN